jgi:hypothetical protein
MFRSRKPLVSISIARAGLESIFDECDQEGIFRSIEESHANVEHLGNWHTHRVNGFPTLSAGDKNTYFKTVNHEEHNTDSFYALLVVHKNRGRDPRYEVKHYFFRRGDDTVDEIPDAQVIVSRNGQQISHNARKDEVRLSI